MAGEICPIFERSEQDNETISLVGAWILHPQNLRILPEGMMFGELGHIAPMAAAFFKNENYRTVSNKRTDVGNGCEFQNGAFVMGEQHAAPNEPNGASGKQYDYLMKNNGGTIILVRSRKPGTSPTPSREQEVQRWFADASARGGPRSPKDFDLFALPNHAVLEWAERVSADPRSPRSCVMAVSELDSVIPALSGRFDKDHGVASRDAVDLFDTYLGAACPKCFGGMNGDLLQKVGVAKSAAAYIGGGAQFQRILDGKCATCESETYHVVWHGDRNIQEHSKPEALPTPAPPRSARKPSVTKASSAPAPKTTSDHSWSVGAFVAVVVVILVLYLLFA